MEGPHDLGTLLREPEHQLSLCLELAEEVLALGAGLGRQELQTLQGGGGPEPEVGGLVDHAEATVGHHALDAKQLVDGRADDAEEIARPRLARGRGGGTAQREHQLLRGARPRRRDAGRIVVLGARIAARRTDLLHVELLLHWAARSLVEHRAGEGSKLAG